MLESPTPTGASTAAEPPAATASPGPGLRERKKQQTRLRIIEVALNLCDTQGFEATTIEQIANAADVSPRTINRYFDSKEDIVLGPIQDFGRAIADALRRLPVTGNELESLREAFLQVVDSAVRATSEWPVSFHQFQQMQRVVRSSPSVGARSLEHADSKNVAIAEAVAERLGTTPDALPVRLILGSWQLIGHLSMECGEDIFDYDDMHTAATVGRNTFSATFDEFLRVCGGGRTGAAD
ncbi:TetR family transcriptional regulator [Nocardia tenerifensis]|uniref:TetR family transcriptional regulator n=1 Tax=Nocardia tenerifensis TaxID=228006 RepID=A0A318K899_9NOCA|nr:TetR/AcrR family transcriptional regulator [Nocardia tenerifensis]PXX66462.1 TetR family transcriptional regulator [Nocardia tenerifensis]